MLSKMKKSFAILILVLSVYGCGFTPLNYSSSIEFSADNNLPNHFKDKIFNINQFDNIATSKVNIREYKFEKYNVYGGNALRSLETELKLVLIINIERNNEEKTKQFMILKRYKSNELNPLAQNEMLSMLRNEMEDELIQQIILEVNLIDL
jgi:outer membrane lipopolysaccharide assembly protein LptE/RlpB